MRASFPFDRIALRIALAMMPALVVVLTLFGVATAAREGEVIALEMQRDADAVATGLAALLARAEVPPDRSADWLADIDAQLPYLRLRIVPLDPPGAPVTPELLQLDDGATERHIVAHAPVVGDDGVARAVVVVTEPLADRDAFVRRALLADAVGVVVATVVAFAFALAVGRSLVQRRVDRVIGRLEAVGRGEYPEEPLALGTDELGTLGRATDEMTAQLRTAREEAARESEAHQRAQLQVRRADRLAAVGRTVAVFAHEVGTPLNVVAGRADRLLRGDDPDVERHARIIREQADRITVFVRRLLDYARHDDRFELRPTSPADVARAAADLLRERARAAEVELRVDAPDDPPVLGDPQALQQVVTNLVSNAVDASPRGSEVVVRVARARCGEGADRLPEEHLHLAVEDAGPGVSDELRDRVFDPFFTTKAPGEGTGLGLSIVREIVGDHGGLVTLEGRDGGGLRAVVHLPILGGADVG